MSFKKCCFVGGCIKAGATCATLLANKQEGHSAHDADEGSMVAPVQRLTQEGDHEDAGNDQRQRFLNDLQLAGTPAAGKTDAIGRNRKAVLNKGNCPADENDRDEWLVHATLEVPIPGHSHENVGGGQEKNRLHGEYGLHWLENRAPAGAGLTASAGP